MTQADTITAIDPVLRVDGRRLLSAETVEAVLEFCDRIAERPGPAVAVLHVTGVPGAGWAGKLTVGLVSKWERALRRLERAPRATVAIATGDCSGTALDVLLAADVRIAVRGARLVPPVHDSTTWPGMALYRLARHAAGAPVRRAALLGAAVDAADAGVVDEVVDDPDAAVAAVARLTAGIAGEELAIRRQLLHDAGHTRFEDALGAHLAACDRALRREAGR